MKQTSIILRAAMLCLATLQGCSISGPRESPLPKSGPKMIDIYERHVEENSLYPTAARERPPTRPYDDSDGSTGFRPAATGAMDGRFVRLPNPDLEMYVYPHLAKGRYPVPGYVTVFPMFEGVQYALPGEVRPRAEPVRGAAPTGRAALSE